MTPVDTLIAEWPLEFNVALMACTFVAAMALLAYGVRILYTSGSILQALAFGTLAFIVLALGGTLLARNGVLHQNLTPAPVSNSAQPGSQEPTSSPVYQCVTPLTPAEQATVNRTRPETPPASAQPVCVLDSTGTRTRVLLGPVPRIQEAHRHDSDGRRDPGRPHSPASPVPESSSRRRHRRPIPDDPVPAYRDDLDPYQHRVGQPLPPRHPAQHSPCLAGRGP